MVRLHKPLDELGLIYVTETSLSIRLGSAVLFVAVAAFIATRPEGVTPR